MELLGNIHALHPFNKWTDERYHTIIESREGGSGVVQKY